LAGWLDRSGQTWKVRGAAVTAVTGFPLMVVGFVGVRRWGPAPLLLGLALAALNLVLPLLVRCRVCGLHLESSVTARTLSRADRLGWIRALESCPSCADDGLATEETRVRWVNSGSRREEVYWSSRRLILAIVLTVLIAGGGFAIGALYRMKT